MINDISSYERTIAPSTKTPDVSETQRSHDRPTDGGQGASERVLEYVGRGGEVLRQFGLPVASMVGMVSVQGIRVGVLTEPPEHRGRG